MKYGGTSAVLRRQLRAHLSKVVTGAREGSEAQETAWALLNDYDEAVKLLKAAHRLLPEVHPTAKTIEAFLASRE